MSTYKTKKIFLFLTFSTFVVLFNVNCGSRTRLDKLNSSTSCGDGICNDGETAASCVMDCVPAPTLTSVTIASNFVNPALASIGDTVTVSITSSEAINAPTVTIAGKAATVITLSSTSYTASIMVSALHFQGVAAINISGFSNLAGKAGDTVIKTTDSSTVTIFMPPSVIITSTATSLSNLAVIPMTATFSSSVTGFTVASIAVTNGIAGSFIAASGTTYTFNVTPTVDGMVTVDIAAGVATDAASNLNTAATQFVITSDRTAPTVTSVTVPANGSYKAGTNLDFIVNFSENITITNTTSTLGLTIGATGVNAAQLSTTATSITYRYTVAPGDTDINGIAVGTITLNTTTVQDTATNNANMALNAVGSTLAVLVDTTAPTVTSVTVPANGSYKAGTNLDFIVNFNENITVTNTASTLGLTIGATGVNAAQLSTTATSITYRYTVLGGDTDIDGITVGTITLNTTTVQDAATNNANVPLNAVGSTLAVLVDTTAPTLSAAIASNNADATLAKVGDTITLTITASESITQPTVTIAGQSATVSAGPASSFTATITVTALDTNGVVVVNISAGYTDSAGNTGAGVATASGSVTIDTLEPTMVSAETLDTNSNGKIDHYKITFSEAVNDSSFQGYVSAVALGANLVNWTVASYCDGVATFCQVDPTVVGDAVNDSVIYIKIPEVVLPGLFDTGAKPDITSTSTSVTDKAGNILFGSAGNQTATVLTADVVEADTAAPVIASVVPGQTSVANDSVVISMSEAVSTDGLACNAAAKLDGNYFGYKEIAGVDATGLSTIAADATWVDTATCYQTKIKVTGFTNLLTATDITNDAVSARTPLSIPAWATPFKDMATPPNVVTDTGSKPLTGTSFSVVINSVTGLVGSESVSFTFKNTSLNPATTSNLTITSPATSGSFNDVLLDATPYQVAVTSSPTGKVCSIKEKQFGSVAGSIVLFNVNCATGYMVGGHYQANPAAPIDYRMYQGKVTTLKTLAATDFPDGLAFVGGDLFYVQRGTHQIFMCTAASNFTICNATGNGTPGTADGIPANAKFYNPRSMISDGTNLYVSQFGSNNAANDIDDAIRKIDTSNGNVTTLISGAASTLVFPEGLALYNGKLYIADRGTNQIKVLNLTTGGISVYAGAGTSGATNGDVTGAPANATFNLPIGLAEKNGVLYVSDYGNHQIRAINLTTDVVTTLTGSTSGFNDGVANVAKFNGPTGIISDGYDLYVSDYGNGRIRRIRFDRASQAALDVSTLVGQGSSAYLAGTGVNAKLLNATYLASDGSTLYFSDENPGTAGIVAKITDNGLVGYWPLSKSEADKTGDYNSDGTSVNNGTLGAVGAGDAAEPAFIATDRYGSANSAYNFDGGDYITTTAVPSTNTTNVSLAAWIKWDGTTVANLQFLFFNGTTASDGYGLALNTSSSELKFMRGGFTGQLINTYLTANKWTHIALVESFGKWAIYVNGKKVSEITGVVNTPTGGFKIGASSSVECFRGSIADVRMYNRVLNEGEINELAQDACGTAQVGSSYNTGATGLLSHYTFDGAANGANAVDVGPLGIAQVNTNAIQAAVGKDGDANGAYTFSGSNYFTSAAGGAAGLPAGNHPRTVCAWVKPSFLPTPVTQIHAIARYGDNGFSGSCTHLGLTNNAGTQQILFGSCGGTTNEYAFVNHTLNVNTWSHVCGSLGAGNKVDVYVNGSNASSTTGITTNWITATSSQYLQIGAFTAAGTYPFNGAIDDVRIYDNALTSDQIRQLAVQVPTGLVAHYDFTDNGGAGDNLKDTSGWKNNLTNNGAIYAVAGGRFGTGDGAYTTGSNAKLNTTTSLGFPTGDGARTICAWYKPNGTYGDPNFNGVVYYGGSDKIGFNVSSDNKTATIYTTYGGFSTFPSLSQNSIWNLACVINNGNSTQSFYVNGSLMTGAAYTMSTANPVLYIGNMGDPTNYYPFNGTIDDVRVYNRALAATEIQALVQQANKKLLVTTATSTGAIGGIAGADTMCQTEFGTTYKAMIVDAALNRRACTTGNCGGGITENKDWVLRPNVTYTRADGITKIFTANWNSVHDFVAPLPAGGIDGLGLNAWTGLLGNWLTDTNHCTNWSVTGVNGNFGITNNINPPAISAGPGVVACTNTYKLYCVEQ